MLVKNWILNRIKWKNNLRIINNISYSTAPLKNSNSNLNIEPTPTVNIGNAHSNTISYLRNHPLYAKLQSKSLETFNSFNSFARGPLRSNILISLEFLKLISAEQKLIPAWSTWPQAKSSYISALEGFKTAWREGRINLAAGKSYLEEVTWGDVGSAARITAEMASFYYIGELLGMIISLPFK